LVVFALCLCLW